MNNTTTKPRPIDIVNAGLAKRYAAEKRFRLYGFSAIVISLCFLGLLFVTIVYDGLPAFTQTYLKLEVALPEAEFDRENLNAANYPLFIKQAIRSYFPEVTERREVRDIDNFISNSAPFDLEKAVFADPSLIGKSVTLWVLADDDVDQLVKGHIDRDVPEIERRMSDRQIAWVDSLKKRGLLERKFNTVFLTTGDSREPEQAGIWGAVMGSFYSLLITLLLSFPIGISAAVYLEEFAPKNKWTDLIEVNINNLAAVPSIVFGLLGLAVFLNFFELPRSAPLVGGLVLTLMTLPVIIIASRAALKSVPPSIREAALGIGSSQLQTVLNHVLPLAMPGMLTGAIIGMARALGETAPLLMIGMVAFIVDVPQGITDAATALPVQIYLWSDSPERGFREKTSAAIIVLLVFLLAMNALAVILRKKFERRW
ncbi:phosphate ABC transporter permease PstA [Megalodesulfovibrio gigas]|uniref:Phosphate transport system permease protein PstA n=1 Tax=Megalodesulfovibrio gigas (strain ATCC 19364 / DSM 1382 / NCIMB 9332 / VKM B-1759) TaxID=1121448 RepID=T2GCP4_MEGG1|nr:phosphate ABC transporter permease PstA [Megalodesulfovibrio gigas]AGW13597.1 putative phosphate ABC transporter, permease protein PstA [Megalodesulfovibrio gigas DSM 1382 = ATCC 19364]AGW13672.1 putative phosphate ABC transporter, permease protein PstA [Megalodesulfovibrio gigas DSM 1382 = ATCC 19364]